MTAIFRQPLLVTATVWQRRGWTMILLSIMLFHGPQRTCGAELQSSPEPEDVPVYAHLTDIVMNAQGQALMYPNVVYYDRAASELFIVDGGAGNITVYNKKFFPVAYLGPSRGVFSPQGLFVDQEGSIYVCQVDGETKKPCIAIYNGAFFLVRKIFLTSFDDADSFSPIRVAVSLDGTLYVVGQNTRGIRVFDQKGNFLRKIAPVDSLFPSDKPGMSDSEKRQVLINEISIDSTGRIYLLSEETSHVYVYDQQEKLLFSIGEKGGISGKLSRPRGLAIDEQHNRIIIVDYMRHTLLVYDGTDGKFMSEFGCLDEGPGWSMGPLSIAVNHMGQLMVADLFNKRVQVMKMVK